MCVELGKSERTVLSSACRTAQQRCSCCCPSCARYAQICFKVPTGCCSAGRCSMYMGLLRPLAETDIHLRIHVPDHAHLQGCSALMTARQSCGYRCLSCAHYAQTTLSQIHSVQPQALAAGAWPRFRLSWPHAEMSNRHLHNRTASLGLDLLVCPSS